MILTFLTQVFILVNSGRQGVLTNVGTNLPHRQQTSPGGVTPHMMNHHFHISPLAQGWEKWNIGRFPWSTKQKVCLQVAVGESRVSEEQPGYMWGQTPLLPAPNLLLEHGSKWTEKSVQQWLCSLEKHPWIPFFYLDLFLLFTLNLKSHQSDLVNFSGSNHSRRPFSLVEENININVVILMFRDLWNLNEFTFRKMVSRSD